jgi:hypothetical protein
MGTGAQEPEHRAIKNYGGWEWILRFQGPAHRWSRKSWRTPIDRDGAGLAPLVIV